MVLVIHENPPTISATSVFIFGVIPHPLLEWSEESLSYNESQRMHHFPDLFNEVFYMFRTMSAVHHREYLNTVYKQ
jgi:hypothetical protein